MFLGNFLPSDCLLKAGLKVLYSCCSNSCFAAGYYTLLSHNQGKKIMALDGKRQIVQTSEAL